MSERSFILLFYGILQHNVLVGLCLQCGRDRCIQHENTPLQGSGVQWLGRDTFKFRSSCSLLFGHALRFRSSEKEQYRATQHTSVIGTPISAFSKKPCDVVRVPLSGRGTLSQTKVALYLKLRRMECCLLVWVSCSLNRLSGQRCISAILIIITATLLQKGYR